MKAQQTLTFSDLEDETNIKFFAGKIAFWDVLISGSRMTFAGGFGGKLYLNGLYVNANYNYHYLDGLAQGSVIRGESVYLPTKSRDGDLQIGYYMPKVKEGKVKVFLKGIGRTKYYALIDAKYTKIFGPQIGYRSGFSNIIVNEGNVAKDYYIDNGERTLENDVRTYMQYGWINAGISFGSVKQVSANFQGYGVKKRRDMERVYGNILYAAYQKLEDVYYDDDFQQGIVHRYVLDGNVGMSKLGFNVGYESYKYVGVDLLLNLELGVMPGVKGAISDNVYLNFKTGLIIGGKF